MLRCFDAGECPVGIFCDLSRAFDSVDHSLLLGKLYDYGFRGVASEWVRSFLINREQYVSLPSNMDGFSTTVNSENRVINLGVPQGSVLGPILFLLFINDLGSLFGDSSLVMYADDVSFLVSSGGAASLTTECSSVVSSLADWCRNNFLFLNISKTVAVRFHNRQNSCDRLYISVGSGVLPSLGVTMFLGLAIDECLGWKIHCERLVGKLNSLSHLFRNLREVLNINQMLSVYHAQVSSRLAYGVCLWGLSVLASDVFLAQKRILRVIVGLCSRSSCREVFKQYKILTLTNMYILNVSLYVFNNRNRFVTVGERHNVNTRSRNDIYVPFCNYDVTLKSPFIMGLRIFNALPHGMKDINHLRLFKRALKSFLFNNVFYTLDEYFNYTCRV